MLFRSKVVVEVAAPEAGRIAEIRILLDEPVNPGDVLCTLDTSTAVEAASEATTEPEDTSATIQDTARERLSPAVRRRASELGLDLSVITGTGSDGRITLADLEKHTHTRPSPPASIDVETQVIAHDKMRKRIADNMVTSLMHTAPHVTAVFEADLGAVLEHRQAHKA